MKLQREAASSKGGVWRCSCGQEFEKTEGLVAGIEGGSESMKLTQD